jgi:hypothetical protein
MMHIFTIHIGAVLSSEVSFRATPQTREGKLPDMTSEFIREKTHASGSLTAAERNEIVDLKRLWATRNVRTEPIDPATIVPAIVGIYAAAGIKKPHIAIAASPLALAFAYGAASVADEVQKQKPRPIDSEEVDVVLAALTRIATVVSLGEDATEVVDMAAPSDEALHSRLREPFKRTEAETHIAVSSEPFKAYRGEI